MPDVAAPVRPPRADVPVTAPPVARIAAPGPPKGGGTGRPTERGAEGTHKGSASTASSAAARSLVHARARVAVPVDEAAPGTLGRAPIRAVAVQTVAAP